VKTLALAWTCLLLAIPCSAAGTYSGGTGEPNNPYRISDANDISEIGIHPNDWDLHFLLINDINLVEFPTDNFNIIGNSNNPFTGVFYGNGYVISNFTYESTNKSYAGFFGVVGENALIRDLTLFKTNVVVGNGDLAGSLVGRLNRGTVTNCHIQNANVIGGSSIGGLVGFNNGGNIRWCDSIVYVSGAYNVGGLVGAFREGIIEYSYTKGIVYSTGDAVGGLVGQSWEDGKISNCYSLCNVQGDRKVGGLVGWNLEGADIENCFSVGKVVGNQDFGGLVGRYYSGEINSCFWDIETSGQSTSAGGTGLPTAQMQMQVTFTDAGWDFVGETVNGIEDIWFIPQEDYPHLWWEFTNSPPIADAGDDQIVYLCADGAAQIELDGSGSADADGDELTYLCTWTIDANEMTATGVDPNIMLPVGLHTINLTVDDGVEISEPNSCVIEVIEGMEVDLQVLPRVINRKNRMTRFLAVVQLPAGIGEDDIDGSFWLYPGEIEPLFCRFITMNGSQKLFMVFDKSELMAAVPDNGPVVLEIEAQLISGRCLYGSDRIRIIRRGQGPREQTKRRERTRFRRNQVQNSR
jgi:hypothetical protein